MMLSRFALRLNIEISTINIIDQSVTPLKTGSHMIRSNKNYEEEKWEELARIKSS